jgi:hypothetical protein
MDKGCHVQVGSFSSDKWLCFDRNFRRTLDRRQRGFVDVLDFAWSPARAGRASA